VLIRNPATLLADGTPFLLLEFDVACHEASIAVSDLYRFDLLVEGGLGPPHAADLGALH